MIGLADQAGTLQLMRVASSRSNVFARFPHSPSAMIRPAVASDSEAIAALLDELGYPASPSAVPPRLLHLREGGRSEAYVAIRDGHVAGLATVQVQASLTREDDVAQLTSLVVGVKNRGAGVGRELVAAVEAYGRAQGCGRIVVTTANHRVGAHAFYARLGWEWTGRRYAKVLAR
jgi:GNAT superfamily N-acetyltransferase